MRGKTVEMMKRVKDLLLDSNYITASTIAEKCGLALSSVYRIIRIMRTEGIGVHITPQGYILSEFAQVQDDTHLIRRLQGRRVSDYMTITAAAPHIKKRWKGIESAKRVGLILSPLMVDMNLVSSSMDTLKALEDRQGIGTV